MDLPYFTISQSPFLLPKETGASNCQGLWAIFVQNLAVVGYILVTKPLNHIGQLPLRLNTVFPTKCTPAQIKKKLKTSMASNLMNALAELFRKLAGNERESAATSLLWMDNLNQNYAKHSQV